MNRKLFTFAFIIICFLLLFNCENIDPSFSYGDRNENELKINDTVTANDSKSAQVWLDSKGPVITFDPYKLWWRNPTAVSVYIYAEDYHSRVDDDSALYRIDNGVWKQPEQVYDDEWEILITKRGTSILTFKLRDNAGNWSTVTEEIRN